MERKVALLFLLIGSVWCQEFECPRDEVTNECIDDGYWNQQNCNTYFTCIDCQFRLNFCPPGLDYNPVTDSCEEPEVARCDPIYNFVNGSAFCAVLSGAYNGPQEPVDYSTTIVNNKNPFNPNTDEFTAFQDGMYFFNIGAGLPPNSTVDLEITNITRKVNLVRSVSVSDNYDVMSRSVIINLSENDTLMISGSADSSIYGDSGKQSYWAGFNIEEFMQPARAFSAVRSAPFSDQDATIEYEDVLVNVGDMYNSSNGVFTAPEDGTYFFTWSTGLSPEFGHRSQLIVTSDTDIPRIMNELWRGPRDPETNALDTLSRSAATSLKAGDNVAVFLQDGIAENTQDTLLSFSGFQYSPKDASHLAWSVSADNEQFGPQDPLVFNQVELNEGNIYNSTTNTVSILESGYYYISISVGAKRFKAVNVLLLSSVTGFIADVYRSEYAEVEPDTLARDLLVYLQEGEEIRLNIQDNSQIFNDFHLQTTFTGFLLYATDNPM